MSEFSMWSEKYQPKTLDECVLEGFPKYVQLTLRKIEQSNRLPNLLLYGIAGTGKSTIARILSQKEMFDVYWKNGSLLTKADVPALTKTATVSTLFAQPKIIFIDEADGLTQPAQYALRSVIEPHVKASWIMTCNFRKKLIEPLASRFMQIECSLPPSSERQSHIAGIVKRCQQILTSESILNVSNSEIEAIASEKYPDIRQTINELQLRYSYISEAA